MKNPAKNSKDKLNLGCGADIRKGFVNIDFEKFEGVNIVYDLNKFPYPFKDNQFKEIIMRNILEHLDNPYNAMKEIRRIAQAGAIVRIRTPHFSSNNVWGDIQHKRGFSWQTFHNNNMAGMFRVLKQKITFSHFKFFMRPFAGLFPNFYEKHLAYIFTAVDLLVELRVIK